MLDALGCGLVHDHLLSADIFMNEMDAAWLTEKERVGGKCSTEWEDHLST
jgi:hypothetical protein